MNRHDLQGGPLAPALAGCTLGPPLVSWLLLALIRFYQRFLSPFLGGQCRFVPSCSRYAYACIEGQGALRGSLLSVVRLCKCHPLHPGGHDPPPPPRRLAPSGLNSKANAGEGLTRARWRGRHGVLGRSG